MNFIKKTVLYLLSLMVVFNLASSGWAARVKYDNIYDAAQHGSSDDVRVLVEAGVNANVYDPKRDYMTPLMLAAQYNKSEAVIEELIKGGANVNTSRDKLSGGHGHRDYYDADTALALAIRYNNNINVLNALLRGGARPNDDKSWGSLPLIQAARYANSTEVVETLIDAGAGLNVAAYASTAGGEMLSEVVTNKAAGTAIAKLLMDKYEVRDKGVLNRALYKAVLYGSEEFARIFLDAGANIEFNNVLITATENNDINMVKFLLEAGAKVNAREIHGKTALKVAKEKDKSWFGESKLVRILRDAGGVE